MQTSVVGQGSETQVLPASAVREIVARAAQAIGPGKRVLVVAPDRTRTCPLPLVARELYEALGRRSAAFDILIALGTHQPLGEAEVDLLLGVEQGQRGEVFGATRVFNHRWDAPAALAKIGTLSAEQVAEISGGKFSMAVDVTINRLVLDYDQVLIVGPVFPHEVVGFSGGNKYFFPGICGPDLLNFFHWLGAVVTSPRIMGVADNPVRRTVEAAAAMIPVPTTALCMVVTGHDLAGLWFGPVRAAWESAAALSRKLHITYLDKPLNLVLSQAPLMYDELWVGAKCMYKLEPVVADGGELIIYAPHIKEISLTHGRLIDQIGYHTLEYFLHQWERFKGFPWGVLAHSTHVRGVGRWAGDHEEPRITVTLATGISEARTRQVNLNYRDPASIDPRDWQDQPGRLYVPKAGEMLYRLKNPPAWAR